MTNPVTVIIPHLKQREIFFQNYTLPSIINNYPEEILILDGEESAQIKRNKGASEAKSEFLFFCDDDVILPHRMFTTLLENIDGYDFAYCDYRAFNHPTPGFIRHTAKPFSPVSLRQQNYISTMSMIRRSAFTGFDESLNRLQDWDLWLSMVENGSSGVYVSDTEFIAVWLDDGITGNDNWNDANLIVRKKHGL